MKLSPLVLGGSVAINIVLAALLLTRGAPEKAASPRPQNSPVPAATVPGNAAAPPAAGKTWAFASAQDIPAMIAQLQAAGCPPSILRALVAQRYELRREELTFDGNDTPYWRNPPSEPKDPKIAEALAKLEREARAVLAQLGPATPETDEMHALRNRRFGPLSAEKVSRIEAIELRFSEERTALHEATGGNFTPEHMATLGQIDQRLRGEIAQSLTPEEFHEYDLRNGLTSTRLRSALVGFNATESEYRALFALYQGVDAKFPMMSAKPEEQAARLAAQGQADEQIKALLGPERFAQYWQASRPEYQQLNQLVVRLDLPISAAAEVAAVQQATQQQATAIRANAQLSPAARAEQLAALAQDATTKIRTTLGARGLEGYRQYGGQWLQQLQPRPNAKAR